MEDKAWDILPSQWSFTFDPLPRNVITVNVLVLLWYFSELMFFLLCGKYREGEFLPKYWSRPIFTPLLVILISVLLSRWYVPPWNTAGRLCRALCPRSLVNQNLIELVALRCWQKSIVCYSWDGTSRCLSHQLQLKNPINS